jgi:Family of unknown function (DUF6286)
VILFARLLARVVCFVALLALAIAGLALAVFCIGTGTSGPSLADLAHLLHLASFRTTMGEWLADLEAPGSVATIAGLCGIGALLLGLLLLAGLLVPRRERLVTLAHEKNGTLAARRRPLAQVATSLVEQVRGVTDARVRVRARRRGGGRLAVRASRTRPTEPREVQQAVNEQLAGLTQPFALTTRIEVPRRGARVE